MLARPCLIISICSLVNRLRTPLWTVMQLALVEIQPIMLQDLNRCNSMWTLQLLRGLRKPTAVPSLPASPTKMETERLTWRVRWWDVQRGRWMRRITGSSVHRFHACLIVCFLPALCEHHRLTQSPRRPIDGAQFILKTQRPLSGLSITKCHRLHGGGDELRRKAPLPVLEPGDRGKKKSRFSMYGRCSREP